MLLSELSQFCDDFLRVAEFSDYCPNGLQVEAGERVEHLVCGVTASLALIEAAAEVGADGLLVHHGYFWKGEAQPLVGPKGRRIRALIENGISLLAYHLPLDVHPEVGNNTRLARVMEWQIETRFGEMNLICAGRPRVSQSVDELAAELRDRLNANPLVITAGDHPVNRLAWCTGAAQDFVEAAAAQGVDAFVSGEISEPTFHAARELGIHYIAAGHHATERYGVQALAAEIESRFGLRQQFIDIPNPV